MMQPASRNPAPPFQLPSVPVDRYKVIYYDVVVYPGIVHVREIHSVYYARANYSEVFPGRGDKSGADVVDAWIVYENGQLQGQRSGWMSILTCYKSAWFATREEAVVHAVYELELQIMQHKSTIQSIQNEIGRLCKTITAHDLARLRAQ